MTLANMLNTLVAREGSERRASARFEIGNTAFNNWRRGRAFPTDEQARRLAELLKLDPAYVLAVIHGERAKTDQVKQIWQRIAAGFATVMLAITVSIVPTPSDAAPLCPARSLGCPVYYVKSLARRLMARLRELLSGLRPGWQS